MTDNEREKEREGERQETAKLYYNRFSKVYDLLSPKAYYHKARFQAVKELRLTRGKTVLIVPVGTGQSIAYFQDYLENCGTVVGIDISRGMLDKAQKKIVQNKWNNVRLLNRDVARFDHSTVGEVLEINDFQGFDAVLCELGLSIFPEWQNVIDNLVSMLSQAGRIVIMDWYIEQPSLRGSLLKWIGKGEVNRPLWQYLETKVNDFRIDSSFNRGGVFVASGTRAG